MNYMQLAHVRSITHYSVELKELKHQAVHNSTTGRVTFSIYPCPLPAGKFLATCSSLNPGSGILLWIDLHWLRITKYSRI